MARRAWPAVAAGLALACVSTDPVEALRGRFVPLPVSGGTLAAADDVVWAAVPDADAVVAVRVVDGALVPVRTHLLPAGARPGRIVATADGAYVTLRGTGEVAQVTGSRVRRAAVCAGPMGLARDGDDLWVACEDGALVRVDGGSLAVLARRQLDGDLRDVVVAGGAVWVSRLRDAAVVRVDPDADSVDVLRPPDLPGRAPDVGWRLVRDGDAVVLAHQRAVTERVDLVGADAFGTPAYGGRSCDAVVGTALTWFPLDGSAPRTSGPLNKSVLPVDLVVDGDARWLVAAGATGLSDVALGLLDAVPDVDAGCATLPGLTWSGLTGDAGGRVVAAAATPAGLVVQTQAPAALVLTDGPRVLDRMMLQDDDAAADGVDAFHAATSGTLACASCHPEGREDGRAWRFLTIDGAVRRRTQSLAGGGVADTAPFHWQGELADLDALLDDTRVARMGMARQAGDVAGLTALLDHIPAAVGPARASDDAVRRGAAVFDAAGCATCHAGEAATDGLVHDVGTTDEGRPAAFATPTLRGLAARGPWMHDGCATTLADRFTLTCGGTAHGEVAAADVPALVAWLSTL